MKVSVFILFSMIALFFLFKSFIIKPKIMNLPTVIGEIIDINLVEIQSKSKGGISRFETKILLKIEESSSESNNRDFSATE